MLESEILLYPQEFEPIRNFTGCSIVSAKQFDLQTLDMFYREAMDIDKKLQNSSGRNRLKSFLNDYIIAVLFYESSTRTRSSFEIALLRLGAHCFTETDVNMSSRHKGEPPEHTVRVLTGKKGGADLVVIRDPQRGFFEEVMPYAEMTNTPIFNGGDGDREHPFQALKDDYTFREHFGTPEGRRFTFLGDIKGSRVIHSSSLFLSLYKNMEINFVAPAFLRAPGEIVELLTKRGVKVKEFDSLGQMEESKEDIGDALYVVRLQIERYRKEKSESGIPTQLEQIYKSFEITADWVKKHPNVNIYHPMPIKRRQQDLKGLIKVPGEIHPEIDFMPQAKYFEQSDNGTVVAGTLAWLVLRDHSKV